MGALISTSHKQDPTLRGVLVLGLDGSGATSILYQLVLGKRLETIPTLGVNHETVHFHGFNLECWDIGGLHKIRPLWSQYSSDPDAIIYVVDAADPERMVCATRELANLYIPTDGGSRIRFDRPLLIFANKQDMPNAADAQVVEKLLRVNDLPVDNFKIFPCTADDRQSLLKGIAWLTDQFKSNPRKPSFQFKWKTPNSSTDST